MSFEQYRRRVTSRGSTAKEIILSERIQSFNDYLDKSISGQNVIIDGIEYLVGIQDVKFHDERSREAKYLFTNLDVPARAGSIVEWDNDYWIIMLRENETIKTHLTFSMTRCNEMLVWQDQNLITHMTPCVLADKTSVYSDGLSKTEFISIGTDQISIQMQSNDLTEKIPLNKRFIFKQDANNIYEATRKDNILNKGLITMVTKKSMYNSNTDNLELNLANYNGKIDPDIPTIPDVPLDPDAPVLPETIIISGLDYFTVWDEDEEYTANTGKPVKWSLNRDDLIMIDRVDGNKCYISSSSTKTIGETILKVELVEDSNVFTEMVIPKFYQ